MTILFNIALVAYLVSLVAAVVSGLSKRRLFGVVAGAALAAGVLALTAYMALRWREAGRPPFSNMFESLVLFAWAIAVVQIFVGLRFRAAALAAASALLAALTLAYASTFESDISPLMPALQSNWLSVHVFTCFLGYAGFAISFLAAIGFLIGVRSADTARTETLDALELTIEKTISFGFLFLTVGIITGAVWANSAWGTYWSWDPKETWSLITWFIYAVFLHCRYMRGWHGKRAAWIAIVGFLSVLFTYVGVNFLLSGLHSYA